ncbi:MAG: hypothetical protein MK538_14055, partial [Planctomycetes bacterium]|nr:hypothetical protein [Planctomycetota bacterium]
MKSSSTLTIVLALVAAPVWGEPVDYSRVVRPILSDHCYACHGPDEAQREAGLQLDSRESAVGRLDSGSVAVVPGRPNESALITRVFAADPDERMPPDGKN